MLQQSPVQPHFTYVVHRGALRGAIHDDVLPLIVFEAALAEEEELLTVGVQTFLDH